MLTGIVPYHIGVILIVIVYGGGFLTKLAANPEELDQLTSDELLADSKKMVEETKRMIQNARNKNR
jgi:hypothetical protein